MRRIDQLLRGIEEEGPPRVIGTITAVRPNYLEALLPGARTGLIVDVVSPAAGSVRAQVASCDGPRVGLLPHVATTGIGPGDEVHVRGGIDGIPCGLGLVGRIIDPFGAPIDGKGLLAGCEEWPIRRPAPDPLARRRLDEQLATGIRVIDGCLSIGKGQRVGLFAGPGTGKSTLLGMLASRAACDVAVVCLVGERGREVGEFIDSALGPDGLARAVVVVATADEPPPVRARAAEAATAAAEWFRAAGMHALLLVDSLTRVARAGRDTALSLGEPPCRGGYPASALASLPPLLERAGRDGEGSITAVYTVLTEDGGEDPVCAEARSLLDGHIILSDRLAQAGLWPAVDVVTSVSRVMPAVAGAAAERDATALRRMLAAYRRNEDLILMGAYRRGACEDTDRAMDRMAEIRSFLVQEAAVATPLDETRSRLAALVTPRARAR